MIDNFELIKTLLDFSEPNTFYFLQILKRRKENQNMRTASSVVDNFYLYDSEDLDKLKEKIIDRCTKHNARAYVNLNRLDLEKVAMYTIKQVADYIVNGEFRAVKNAYATVCGSHHSEKNKKWVIDVDANVLHLKDEILRIVKELHILTGKDYGVVAEIPTKSGVHIISNPFNLEAFRIETAKILVAVDVQKNSPTVCYIPDHINHKI